MTKAVKKIILTLITAIILIVPSTAMAVRPGDGGGGGGGGGAGGGGGGGGAVQTSLNGNLCGGSNFDLSGTTGDTSGCKDTGTNSVSSKIKTLLNLLSAVVGVVAVIMIIYAGFRYVTSAGSESGVKTAKNAIIYAIIGLVVVAFAQIIVHFVISNVT